MPDFSSAHTLAASQHGVISREQAVQCGLRPHHLAQLVRTGRWRRLRAGVYLVRNHPVPALAARVMAAQLVYGPRAVAVGPTAARLWQMQGLLRGPGHDHLHLALPGGRTRTSQGARVYPWCLPPESIVLLNGLRLTSPGRTVRDTVLLTDRYSAVSVLDSALNQGLVARADLPVLEAANAGRPGARRTRGWWPLADSRAQGTLETRLRLICHDAGLAPEELQYPVHAADGQLVGHADLAWPSWGLLVEADGSGPHSLPEALFYDRRRQNQLLTTADRLVLLRFTWRDLCRPGDIVAMIREVRDSRSR